MSTLALSPVSAGIFAALNVSTLTDLATGGISDLEVPEGAGFPRVWFTVSEESTRGLGRGGLRQLFVRVYGADRSEATEGVRTLQLMMAAVVLLLEDAALTIAGYRQGGEVVYVGTTEPYDEIIAGVPCKECAAHFYLWAEPA